MSYCCSDPYENSDRTCRTHTVGPHAYGLANFTLLTQIPYGPVRTRMVHINELKYDKNQQTCAPSEDSDQPGHPPSLIRVFTRCALNG